MGREGGQVSSKVIDVRAGNKWTKCSCGIGGLYLYREEKCVLYITSAESVVCDTPHRNSCERDIPTPEALAQLREWGYEVRGEVPAKTLEVNVAIIPESRVIEIVESVLAKRSHTGHYSHAVDDARVREIVTGMLAAQHSMSVATVDQLVAETKAEVWAAKAKPAPEPDWKGLLRELVADIDHIALGSVDSNDMAWHKENWDKLFASPALAAARKGLSK